MSDLISRQVAIKAIENLPNCYNGYSDTYDKACIIGVLEELPSAQPEIIRCKDCRFYEWMSNRVPEEQTWHCHNWNTETGKNDFCSYAERRTDE